MVATDRGKMKLMLHDEMLDTAAAGTVPIEY